MYKADQTCKMKDFSVDNVFVEFKGCLFRQVVGIPVGTNCAQFLAKIFLYSYESEFLNNLIRSGHRRLARSFNLCLRYLGITTEFTPSCMTSVIMINFHFVKFPFMSSNIPSGPSYMQDAAHAHVMKGYKVNRMRNSFQRFYGRYPDLIPMYQRSVGSNHN